MRQEYCANFRAMGTEIAVIAVAGSCSTATPKLLAQVEAFFRREEARFSRFRADSELSRLNQEGRLEHASPELWDVLERAERWWRLTGGDFDPTILTALEVAGYTGNFAELNRTAPPAFSAPLPSGFQNVRTRIKGARRQIWLERGARLDLGGIVKGWAADRAAALLAPLGDYLIDAGGDLFAAGDSIDGRGWWIGVENPARPGQDLGHVEVRDQALATSGVYRRRWQRADGALAHHLIDPKTGAPSASDLLSVTVLSHSVETSGIYAKVALLRGSQRGLSVVELTPGLEGLLIPQTGAALATAGWPAYSCADGSVSECSSMVSNK